MAAGVTEGPVLMRGRFEAFDVLREGGPEDVALSANAGLICVAARSPGFVTTKPGPIDLRGARASIIGAVDGGK